MAGYIIFENTPITNIIDDITLNKSRDYNTTPYIGGDGSSTNFVSQLGRVITFKSICPYYDELDKTEPPITTFKNLSETYKNKTGVLTSSSHLNLKGNYLITNFEVVEDTGNNFTINWEFTEVVKFNSVKKTFRVWGSAAKSASTKKQKKTAKTSGNKLNKTTKKLLKSCGTLKPSNKPNKCVKYLQKFLQSLGYYKKHKIDGVYGSKTKTEVKKLQKKKKLKQTGNWDKDTIKYFQKKYKYPSKTKTSKKNKKSKK